MPTDLATRLLKADPAAISAAARVLGAGGLVAFPTETVYGLGADAGNGEAVARLYAAKARPAFNPLICHVPQTAAAARLGTLGPEAARLAKAFWPGPLTLVLPKAADAPVSELATTTGPSGVLVVLFTALYNKPAAAHCRGRRSATITGHAPRVSAGGAPLSLLHRLHASTTEGRNSRPLPRFG